MTDINRENTPFYHSSSGDTEEDKKLLEPFKYILQVTEKQIHKQLTLAFNHWLKISFERIQQIDEIIHIFYNTVALFDDIQDDSVSRESSPTAYSIYRLCNTINSANYMQFIVLEKSINLHPMAVKIVIEEMLEFNRGQEMDMYWKEYFSCPNERDYKIMALRKCSWVVKLTVRLMKLFSTYEGDFSSLINVMGLYYQINNDYCNFYLSENTNDGSYCNDVTEGKFSFLIIHALTNNPDDKRIINILKQRTNKIEMKCFCIKLLENFGSFKYTRDVLKELSKKMRIEIERLGGNPLLLKMLDKYDEERLKTHVCEF